MFLTTLRSGLELLNVSTKTIVMTLVLVRLVSMFMQTYPAKCPPLDPMRQVIMVVIMSRVLRFL